MKSMFKRKTNIKVKKKNPYPKYKFKKDLGVGGFATVKLYRKGDKFIAVKRFDKSNDDSKFEFDLEIRGFDGAGKHEHVVSFLDAYEDEMSYNIILEYCEQGVLSDIFKKFPRYSEREVRDVVMQCCNGLQHLLLRKVIHRDIKPDNILVKQWKPIHVVIADFNFSKKIRNLKNKTTLQTELGTNGYMAPEIENKDLRKKGKSYNYTIDVFALGVVAYELITKKIKPNFELPNDKRAEAFKAAEGKKLGARDIIAKAKQDYYQYLTDNGVPLKPEDKWENISDEAKDVIQSMIVPIYTERPSYDDLLSSKWATKTYPKSMPALHN